jgi:hypothetical protein
MIGPKAQAISGLGWVGLGFGLYGLCGGLLSSRPLMRPSGVFSSVFSHIPFRYPISCIDRRQKRRKRLNLGNNLLINCVTRGAADGPMGPRVYAWTIPPPSMTLQIVESHGCSYQMGQVNLSTIWFTLKLYTRDESNTEEFEIYQHLSKSDISHPSYPHVRTALDRFTTAHHGNYHHCLVQIPMWER